MTMHGNLGQIHRNLESPEIWNCPKTVRAQGVAAKIQISAKSGLKSRNLAQALVSKQFLRRPRFWRNSPHYMWAKPQAFRPCVGRFSPAPIPSPRTGERP